jgi:hypothetical protein
MIALASVIASPLFVLCARREAAALHPKEVTKSAVFPTLPRIETDRAVRSQPSRHSLVDNLVYKRTYDNCIVSVYCSVNFVNLQFVTYMTT